MSTSVSLSSIRGEECYQDDFIRNTSFQEGTLSDTGVSVPAGPINTSNRANRAQPNKIVGEFYDPLEDDFLSFEGVLISKDKRGLSFLSKRPLEEEMPVLLKRLAPCMNIGQQIRYMGKHAEVVQCRKSDNPIGVDRYRIQVRYFDFKN